MLNANQTIEWTAMVARYIIYILTARGVQKAFHTVYNWSPSKKTFAMNLLEDKLYWMVYSISSAVVVASNQWIFDGEFPFVILAYLFCQYVQNYKRVPMLNYGSGMACSFFEGYLKLVIPPDGAQQVGLVDKIRDWESTNHVVLPVKRLVLVITRSLHCPPDLSQFNDPDRRHAPQIEACSGLETLKKDVAAVIGRKYKNTVYRVHWPNSDDPPPPVHVVAECATPMHTLYGVLQNHTLYQELVNADKEQLMEDFCAQLEKIVSRSPACAGKIEIVRFDDTPGSGEYLPTVLLNKIAEIEPEYRDMIARRAQQYEDGDGAGAFDLPAHADIDDVFNIPEHVLHPPEL